MNNLVIGQPVRHLRTGEEGTVAVARSEPVIVYWPSRAVFGAARSRELEPVDGPRRFVRVAPLRPRRDVNFWAGVS